MHKFMNIILESQSNYIELIPEQITESYSTRNKIIGFWNTIPLFIKHSSFLKKIFKKKTKQYIPGKFYP